MNTFPKQEKLCGRTCVQALFREGKRFVVWPLRVTFLPASEQTKTAVLMWAPKSLFKHAVNRNRLKRQMREAYRLNKNEIEDKGLQVAFNYMDKAMQPYAVIEKAMRKAITRLLTIENV